LHLSNLKKDMFDHLKCNIKIHQTLLPTNLQSKQQQTKPVTYTLAPGLTMV